jgi:general secretion pathway protein I
VKKSGFTLIEVLIALSVIALCMVVYITISIQKSQHLIHIENKSIAQWIAEDVATQIQVGLITLPSTLDTLSDNEVVFDREWTWSAKFTPTEDKTALHTEITVKLKNGNTDFADYITTLTP